MLVWDRTIIMVSASLIALLLLFLKHRVWRVQQEMRLLFCLPLFIVLLHIAMTDVDICLTGLYIGVLLVAGCFLCETISVRKGLCIGAMVCVLLTFIPCLTSSAYRRTHYKEEFVEGFQVMKEHYVLSEYKEIDWDKLYAKYAVKFEQADVEKNRELAFEIWNDFVMEFHDAHVQVVLANENEEESYRKKYIQQKSGYDYGFSLVTLENGNTVFANVKEESDAYQQGIRNGMVVTAFEGVDICQKKEESDMWFSVFPDKDNEAFYQSVAVTCSGGESVSVTYVDDAGAKKDVVLMGQGNGYEQWKETMFLLTGNNEKTNLTCGMISDDVAYLVINEMMVEPTVQEQGSTEEEKNYSGLKKCLKKQIAEMKENGATKLIVDLRGNPGGYLEMSVALASLFSKEESFAAAEGVYDDAKQQYEIVDSIRIHAEDVWGDGEIVVLVNANTTSAAELFAYFMSRKDNVTVMGMTKSAGSVMATSGYTMDSFQLRFPMMLLLDENGNVLIDSDASGINNAPLDVRIPLDEDAFVSIFEKREDYVLQYAMKYLGD